MQPGYKERIVLHALHPRKRNASNPVTMASFVFYASLFDLAERGIFKIESGKIYCQEKETGEPVLDKLLSILVPLSGKKLSRLQLTVLKKTGPVYKMQIEEMVQHNFLLQENIHFLAWKVGSRYRVRNRDLLKPAITKMERALIYGRKPDRETLLMTLLLGEAELFNNIFSTREYRQKAIQRYKKILKEEHYLNDETISGIIKSLRNALKTRQSINSATRTG